MGKNTKENRKNNNLKTDNKKGNLKKIETQPMEIFDFIFPKCYVIDSVYSYKNIINEFALRKYWDKKRRLFIREKFIYRGFSKPEQLISGLKKENLLDNELELIQNFENHNSVHLGQYNNPIDLVAAAEHYGLFTRLIDWSYSPLVATLFALSSGSQFFKEQDYYVVAVKNEQNCVILNQMFLNNLVASEGTGREEHNYYRQPSLSIQYKEMVDVLDRIIEESKNIPENIRQIVSNGKRKDFEVRLKECLEDKSFEKVYNYFKRFPSTVVDEKTKDVLYMLKKLFSKNFKILLETNYSNKRITNQKGLFEIDFENEDIKTKISKADCFLVIKNEARKEIIKYISSLGIDYFTLMDDPENVARTINSLVKGNFSISTIIGQ